jgi:hypothetical protein
MTFRERFRSNLENVKEESGDEREDDVDEEAVVGLKTENSSCDSEEGSSKTVEIGKSLGVVDHGLRDDWVDLEFAFGRHCCEYTRMAVLVLIDRL